MHDILDWQKRFRAGPRVWLVIARGEETGNVYESKEAAEVEAGWWRERGERVSVRHEQIHTMQLALERWRNTSPPSTPGEPATPDEQSKEPR